MKTVLLRFGWRAFFVSIVIFLVFFLIGKLFTLPYSVQEVLGYLSIVLSLFFIFLAQKYYRDKVNEGQLTFKNGMLLGLGITLFVGLGSAIADLIYTTVIYPDFIIDYTEYQVGLLQASVPDADFEASKTALLEQVEKIGHPVILALIMFFTVLPLGVIITLLSSLLLQRTSRMVSNS